MVVVITVGCSGANKVLDYLGFLACKKAYLVYHNFVCVIRLKEAR